MDRGPAIDENILGFSPFQWIIVGILIIGVFHYLWLIWEDKYATKVVSGYSGKEGFQDARGISDSEQSKTIWFENDELFDDFYCSVYDNLTQLAGRFPQEVSLILNQWKKETNLDSMDILDCGCGTAIATILFARQDVNSVTGLDLSDSMLRRARSVTLVAAKLTESQKNSITLLKGNMMQETTFPSGKFSHACLLFFVVYYAEDPLALFRNLYLWIRPGGQLAIEVVNKYKFDPLLESSSPFVGLSLQKYHKKRQTKSKVEFDKFSYEAEFDLQDPVAEFRETFRFKDKSVRRQRHTMTMRDINEIVKIGEQAGWTYNGYIDLLTAGFEYAYVLMFTHP